MPETLKEVMEIATMLSGGNKFKKFKRSERRTFLEMMEAMSYDLREMSSNREQWLRFGEILHPGEYKVKYPKTFNAFLFLRKAKVRTWEGKLNYEFKRGFTYGLNMLVTEPEKFFQKFDWLIRDENKNIVEIAEIANKLKIVAGGMTKEKLEELHAHLSTRTLAKIKRVRIVNRKIVFLRKLKPIPVHIISIMHDVLDNAIKNKTS